MNVEIIQGLRNLLLSLSNYLKNYHNVAMKPGHECEVYSVPVLCPSLWHLGKISKWKGRPQNIFLGRYGTETTPFFFFLHLVLLISKEVAFCRGLQVCSKYLHLIGDFQIHLWKVQKHLISSAKLTVILNWKSPPHSIC